MEDIITSLFDLKNVIETVEGIFVNIFGLVLEWLPNSPFQKYIYEIPSLPYLPELNWFIPINDIIYVTGLWLSAILLYYVWSVILRFVRAIK